MNNNQEGGMTMAHGFRDHDWRVDEYSWIRGDLHADVQRAWCADSDCADPWRWTPWRIDGDGGVEHIEVPITVKRGGFRTAEDAMRAAVVFIESRSVEELYRRAASFEGVPVHEEVF